MAAPRRDELLHPARRGTPFRFRWRHDVTTPVRQRQLHAGRRSGQLKLGTGEHYVQILRAESGLEVAESNVRTLQAHTELAHRQYEFGSVPKNDFLAASVALADAEQRKLQAENALDYSR
jgi:outer membrane protein TolC